MSDFTGLCMHPKCLFTRKWIISKFIFDLLKSVDENKRIEWKCKTEEKNTKEEDEKKRSVSSNSNQTHKKKG